MILGKPDPRTNVNTLGWEGEQHRMCIETTPTPLMQGRLRANIHTLSHKTEKAFKVE